MLPENEQCRTFMKKGTCGKMIFWTVPLNVTRECSLVISHVMSVLTVNKLLEYCRASQE